LLDRTPRNLGETLRKQLDIGKSVLTVIFTPLSSGLSQGVASSRSRRVLRVRVDSIAAMLAAGMITTRSKLTCAEPPSES
jgi:hypothetical protein